VRALAARFILGHILVDGPNERRSNILARYFVTFQRIQHRLRVVAVLRASSFSEVKIAFIIARKEIIVVLFGTLKVQSFMLTEVRDCDLPIVVTSSTFLKRKDMLKDKSS